MSKAYKITLLLGIIAIIFCGAFIYKVIGDNKGDELRVEQIQLSQVISSILRHEYVEKLSATPKDTANEYFLRIKDRFIWIQNHHPLIRYIYIIGKENEKYFFYLDSESDRYHKLSDSKPLAVPGEIYNDCPPELELAFHKKRPVSVGPYTDKWGTFISAFIPVVDNKGNVVAVSGIDMQASEWNESIWQSRFPIILITILISFLYFFVLLYFNNRKKIEVKLEEANNQLELKVVERTKELSVINDNLKKEIETREKIEKELIEKERRLKMQNEEYLALNEELKESYNRIEDINKELKKEKEKAEESDRLKSAFLANMSHEIRTPMNGILGFAELLKDKNFAEKERLEFIELIQSSGNQLLSIINDVIDISKIEAGQVSVHFTNTDIHLLLDEVVRFYNPAANSKKISIELIKPVNNNFDFIFFTDEVKLKQIIMNLVSNAVKFTNAGTVMIGYELIDNFVRFFVKDTGIGIAAEYHNNIFDRFWQVQTNNEKIYGGTGLGLSVSKALVETLGGTIWVNSETGKGSEFYFTIPVNSQDVDKIKNSNGEIEMKNSHDSSLKDSIKGKTILVAEDEEINYLFIKKLLSCHDLNILWAKNGKEAVEIYEKHQETDLILMDIKMPVMDGYEATRVIRAMNASIPIIAQTAYTMSEDKKKAINAGCTDYLTKPLSKDILLQRISTLLRS